MQQSGGHTWPHEAGFGQRPVITDEREFNSVSRLRFNVLRIEYVLGIRVHYDVMCLCSQWDSANDCRIQETCFSN